MGAGRRAFLCCPALGFTLIEIVFVLGIMAVLAAIALPNWGTLLPDYNLRGGARQVQSEFHRIKSQAVSENVTFRLVFSDTADNYTIERVGATTTQAGIKSLPEGIDLRTAITLGFTSTGTATPGTGGTVMLCNSKNAGTNIVISSSGRIRVCSPTLCGGTC